MESLSKKEACVQLVKAQALATFECVTPIEVIRRLSYVQLDTIHIVERAHHHVLWSRVEDYRASQLADLMNKKLVFEYWSHAASVLPIEDFRFSLPRKHLYRSGKKHWFPLTKESKKLRAFVREKISAEGPLGVSDFSEISKGNTGGWFTWSPIKKVVEQMFMEGHLMVKCRRGFEKVYDLEENMLPHGLDTSLPSQEEYARYLIRSALRASGLASLTEIAYMRPKVKAAIQSELRELMAAGEIKAMQIEKIDEIYYCWKDSLVEAAQPLSQIRILSPFDNLVIQRKRLQRLFGFDYTIECYVPEEKRKFGYFSLPILEGAKFMGRIDLKAHRAKKELEVIAIHAEKGVKKSEIREKIKTELARKMEFNSCESVIFRTSK